MNKKKWLIIACVAGIFAGLNMMLLANEANNIVCDCYRDLVVVNGLVVMIVSAFGFVGIISNN